MIPILVKKSEIKHLNIKILQNYSYTGISLFI